MKYSLFIIIVLLQACNSGFSSEKEFFRWLSDESNGLLKSRDFGTIKVRMKYLPEEYLIYKELRKLKTATRAQADSVAALFKDTRTFLMTFEFDDVHAGENPLLSGVNSYNDYQERIEKLSFAADEHIWMETESDDMIKPLIWTMENTFTPGNKRNLYLVFPRESPGNHKLSMVFQDGIFYTGPSRFVFNKTKLEEIPRLNFLKKIINSYEER